MVFDPNAAKYDLPPAQTRRAAEAELEAAIEATPKYYSAAVKKQTVPVNVDALAKAYEAVGLDPAEAKVPKPKKS
jgi:hypothetical protein